MTIGRSGSGRVCLIGGSGFIGGHIADALLREGVGVRSFDLRPEPFRPPLPEVEYLFGDVRDAEAVRDAISGCDTVIHTLTTTTPESSNEDIAFDIGTNLVPSVAMLDSCVAEGVDRVVYLSSGGTVYGIPEVSPTPETHPLEPAFSYAVVKVAMEKYLGMYRALHGLESIVLRLSNPYGPRQDPAAMQGAVAVFAGRALAGETIPIWGDGTVVRDFVDVRDVARAIAMAATGPVRGGTFNVGSGAGTSLNDLVGMLEDVLGRPVAVERSAARTADVPHSVLDTRLIRDALGWQPRIGLREGLADYLDWLRLLPVAAYRPAGDLDAPPVRRIGRV